MSRKAVACVIGDMDLVRALGLAGIPCVVVAPPGAPERFSRFTRGAIDKFDAWEQAEQQVDALMRFGSAQPEPPVLFYDGDPELLLISRYRDRLRQAFRLVIPEANLVEDLVDKGRFQVLAERLGILVPASQRLTRLEDWTPGDHGLRFPLILKPLTRRADRWRPLAGSLKVQQIDSQEELLALWPRLVAARLDVLLQELIPGPESLIESYHVYVDETGTIVGEFTGQKIRTLPERHGYSTALIITDAPDVAALGRDLVRRLNLRGVAKFDFKRGPDGRLYLLEVNPRFTLWNHPGAMAGVNLPALVYGDLTGAPRPAVPRARAGVRWCSIRRDVFAARAAGVPVVRWLPWALRCEAKRAVAWDDPMPMVCGGLWRWFARQRGGAP